MRLLTWLCFFPDACNLYCLFGGFYSPKGWVKDGTKCHPHDGIDACIGGKCVVCFIMINSITLHLGPIPVKILPRLPVYRLFKYCLLSTQSVGCDKVVGSGAEFDRCGVCNGDSTSCTEVIKEFKEDHQVKGEPSIKYKKLNKLKQLNCLISWLRDYGTPDTKRGTIHQRWLAQFWIIKIIFSITRTWKWQSYVRGSKEIKTNLGVRESCWQEPNR